MRRVSILQIMSMPLKSSPLLCASALKFRGFAIAVSMAVLLSVSAIAAPQMPMGFKVSFSSDSGRAWRQTGTLPQPFAMARATVAASMRRQGYELVHDIAESETAIRRLLFWRRNDEDVILMLWQEDLWTTGVSWGISTRGSDEGENVPFP